jgi:D-beta-D-heptose 7-phosphate kinase/D-beta-D-heptose 1-phosphate adenosyltransferase
MVTPKLIQDLVNRFEHCTILVLGDLMLDEYLWGHVERISPEAPVPVLSVLRREYTLGGAGNTIKNIRSLNANVLAAGVLGADQVGEMILKELEKLKVSTNGVVAEEGRSSTKKTRLMSVDRSQQVFRIDQETRQPICTQTEKRILSFVEEVIEQVQALLISDYSKGVVTQSLAQSVIQLARRCKVPVVVDPKASYKHRYKYAGATTITPNLREASQLSGIEIDSEETLEAAGLCLLKELELESVLITKGAKGISLFTANQHIQIPAEARQVYDVTGAGDTVAGVFALAIAAGVSYEIAARLANTAAGIVVGKVGTATVSKEELLQHHLRLAYSEKILSLETLKARVEEAKSKGQVIVFTNGCFDLLHIGHVQYLRQARELGDILIVGLNSDDSVRRLKGNKRPIIPQHERAMILAALETVDYVVIFEEDTPYELIKALQPHVLVKGKDYSLAEVVGRDIVESNGGRVELIDLVEGRSTSTLIDIIKNL